MTRLLKQAYWLNELRRPVTALEINEEAIRHCRSAGEPVRTARLSQLLHNHYGLLCKAKLRNRTEECLRTIHHEFAASTYSTYLPGVTLPVAQADLPAVLDLIARYDDLPADDPARLPGRVVAHCAYARLPAATGQRHDAQTFFNVIALNWAWWCREGKTDQCAALAIGMELLEIAELFRFRLTARSFRRHLMLPGARPSRIDHAPLVTLNLL